jgi:gluconokinase
MRNAVEMRSVVVMGVSGSGKSTIASALGQRTGVEFIDADWLHTPANLAKMSAGRALDDEERLPWLHLVGQRMKDVELERASSVVACSALKRIYRDVLRDYVPDAFFVMLDASLALLTQRITARRDGVLASLLTSQLATLEELKDDERGMRVDVASSPDEIVGLIVARLGSEE